MECKVQHANFAVSVSGALDFILLMKQYDSTPTISIALYNPPPVFPTC
jgi:hypothetical protein